MNILASYNWIKEYLKTDLTASDFARELSLRSMSVEKIELLGEKFNKIVVGVIKEVKAHPNANKLRVTVTDIGGKEVEIVCGGSNLEVGQKVVVALPGSKVRWHGEGDLVELAETEIRGVKSIGMICAAVEVGFEKIAAGDHEIWDITKITDAAAGTPIAEALKLEDTVFDIEITTNRPDCMSIIGLAREGAAAVNEEFISPVIRNPLPTTPSLPVTIDSKLCDRYMAATVTNVKVGPSPWWLQQKLLLAGHRPINNIVDITNFILHEYGQPLHAFDASKLRGGTISVREAKKGETLKALDGKTYELSKKNLVIADAEGPLAVAGVMGGLDSGTTESTTTVIFEAATFDAVSIRRTARDLNLYSDSQLVFEKGLSTEALPPALARALELAVEIAGGEVTGVTDVQRVAYKPQVYSTTTKKIRDRIGVPVSDEQIISILQKLGFSLEIKGAKISATVPYFRDHDIEAEVDLTEEVARIYGYHLMPSTLPTLVATGAQDDASITWESRLKKLLAAEGYTEFFGLSLVDAKDLERYGLSPMDSVKLLNPLTEDLSYLRPSLIPGVLKSIERNQANVRHAHVFELSRVYVPTTDNQQTITLPLEELRLVIAKYGFDSTEEAFMTMKGTLEAIGHETGLTFHLNRMSDDSKWHASRSAQVFIEQGPERILAGTFGQVAYPFTKAFGVEEQVFMLELNIERLLPHFKKAMRYVPVTEFPVSKRDISIAVAERTSFEDLIAAAGEASSLLTNTGLVDIYRGKGVEEGKKSMTLSLTFAGTDRTLTSEEVESAMKSITDALQGKFGATVRG
jgi:phenylalanyl-tRNA synthetase beta chain